MGDFGELPRIAGHIELYKRDPDRARMWDSGPSGGKGLLPTLLLTTIGRRSGEPRSVPLIYAEVRGSYVIVASKEGLPGHPIWFLNLQANAACELLVGRRQVSAIAREAHGEERDLLWQQMAALYPPYVAYQERATERQIPVVVLDPTV